MSRFRSYFPQQVLTAIDAGSRVNMLLPLLFLGMVAHVIALAIEIEPLYDKYAEERGFAAKEGHTGYGVVHAREAGPSKTPESTYNGQHDGHGWYGHGPAPYGTFSDVHARDAYAAPDPARPQWWEAPSLQSVDGHVQARQAPADLSLSASSSSDSEGSLSTAAFSSAEASVTLQPLHLTVVNITTTGTTTMDSMVLDYTGTDSAGIDLTALDSTAFYPTALDGTASPTVELTSSPEAPRPSASASSLGSSTDDSDSGSDNASYNDAMAVPQTPIGPSAQPTASDNAVASDQGSFSSDAAANVVSFASPPEVSSASEDASGSNSQTGGAASSADPSAQRSNADSSAPAAPDSSTETVTPSSGSGDDADPLILVKEDGAAAARPGGHLDIQPTSSTWRLVDGGSTTSIPTFYATSTVALAMDTPTSDSTTTPPATATSTDQTNSTRGSKISSRSEARLKAWFASVKSDFHNVFRRHAEPTQKSQRHGEFEYPSAAGFGHHQWEARDAEPESGGNEGPRAEAYAWRDFSAHIPTPRDLRDRLVARDAAPQACEGEC